MSRLGYLRKMAEIARTGIPARFPSICRSCSESINPGDLIVPVGGGAFAHLKCPTGEDE